MKKLFGLAALVGVATGAAYYLKKVGALTVTNEEQEDGSRKMGLELKLPRVNAFVPEEDDLDDLSFDDFDEMPFEDEDSVLPEVDEELFTEEFDAFPEEEEEEEEKKLSISFTIGPEANAKLRKMSEKAAKVRDDAIDAVVEMKDNVVNTVKGMVAEKETVLEEVGDECEDVVEDVCEEIVDEVCECAEEAAEDME